MCYIVNKIIVRGLARGGEGKGKGKGGKKEGVFIDMLSSI